ETGSNLPEIARNRGRSNIARNRRGTFLSSGQDRVHRGLDREPVNSLCRCGTDVALLHAFCDAETVNGGTPMRRLAPCLIIISFLVLLPARADALTVRDIVELTRAGLGEEVLLALIEIDRSIFPIDAASIKQLKVDGVSERVIVAMVRSGREVPSEQVTPDPAPLPP